MNSFVKWTFRLLTIATLLGVAFLIGLYMLVTRSLPDYSQSFETSVQGYDVEIIRDSTAIPHIYGADLNQVMFGLGVVHAQDRLWQMAMMRRTVQGRISEIAGADTLEIDLFLRALDLWNLSNEHYKQLGEREKLALQAYADGVNSWVEQVNENKLGAGGPEFLLVDGSFAPWTPTDSIAILNLMALQLTSAASDEILRTRLASVLSPQQLQQFFADGVEPVQLIKFANSKRETLPTPLAKALSPTGYGKAAGASNAFAVAPERSVSDQAILASDPHLTLTAPAIWFLAHMETPENTWVGGTIPGLPSIVIGHSHNVAWGLTTPNLDDQDIVILKMTPDEKSYETANGTQPLKSRDTYIQVKGESEPRVFTLHESAYGPLIPSIGPWDVGTILPPGHLAALSWTALHKVDKSYKASLGLMMAKNTSEAMASLEDYGAPAQMFTLADKNGNIAQMVAGRIPMRSAENLSKGLLPSISWQGDAGFQDYFPPQDNPKLVNPNTNLLMHTNNKFIDEDYPKHFSYSFGDNYRIRRAESLLGKRKVHSPESMKEAQNDSLSMDARIILPFIAGDMWFQPADDGIRGKALEMLGNWNGEFQAINPEPLIYSTWLAELDRLIFADELGELYDALGQVDPYRIEIVVRDVDGASQWCDIKPTPEIETCQQLAELSLDRALENLQASYGPEIENWRWGRAHRAFQKNQTLGNIPILGNFAHILNEADGGTQTLLRAASHSSNPMDFTATHGAALRMVVNFADIENSSFIISTGQSGNLLSKHYDDLSTLWATGEYLRLSTKRQIVEGNSESRMVVRSREASATTAQN